MRHLEAEYDHVITDVPGYEARAKSCPIPLVRDIVHVKSITYTAARESLAATMQTVCEDCEPVIITRKRDQAVVMISLDDYESMQETLYLQRSPANAERLQEAINQLESDRGIRRELPEVE